MTIDSIVSPTPKRIAGTLHKRGYVHPAPLRDENRPGENDEEGEALGRHQNSGQEHHNGARWPMANGPPAPLQRSVN